MSVWKCSAVISGASSTLGVRQNVYQFASENIAFYDNNLKRQSIRYDRDKKLLVNVIFETKNNIFTFENSLRKYFDGFNHQQHSTLSLSLESFTFEIFISLPNAQLERVLHAHYNPSEFDISPQTSTAQLYQHTATSVNRRNKNFRFIIFYTNFE